MGLGSIHKVRAGHHWASDMNAATYAAAVSGKLCVTLVADNYADSIGEVYPGAYGSSRTEN